MRRKMKKELIFINRIIYMEKKEPYLCRYGVGR